MVLKQAVEYDKPQVEEKVNKIFRGVLKRIIGYEFSSHSESVPGSNRDTRDTKTSIEILIDVPGEPYPMPLVFEGFVGRELEGQKVQYEDRTKITTTFFDPKGRENDPSYRRGEQRTERVCKLLSLESDLPCYIFRETSQCSL